MSIQSIYMERSLQLARKGAGFTGSNPMVGAVIVSHDRIIGEGYHHHYGGPHAEVNAIDSVREPSLLSDATLYVSLEPCSHYGKTPPCAALIVARGIPRVVVAVTDPNPMVSGKGITMMRAGGVEVTVGLLEQEARELNRVFFVNQLYKRPYVTLKWAESHDGYMDHLRSSLQERAPAMISNPLTQTIVHKLRTQLQGILVGTNTALLDDPQLTSRKWFGSHPTRIVIDRENRIPSNAALFNGMAPTILFSASAREPLPATAQVKQIIIDFSKETNRQILTHLYNEQIHSLLVEGGATLLNSFIGLDLWDEAYVEQSEIMLYSGVKAPEIQGEMIEAKNYAGSMQFHLKSKITRNFL
ncbi:MAG: bifunctional diaminohydroxyphosphoribosylaminopyrimidine deaminase/5-amino-6-(5-phosphoribosylamino)uracil reductase RibD [Proteiniphilum sp.]|jgi:diaminohydroxyphosphoribosylaminopyrimidine deaminase/5-amino-6-(5-phosphoribosylamino)uracil reductase|nr:bifunctional diaminohydroxyphosphoribosylaminopyrimidine deaminase/5-amino-6-(5-phosphoribosylamino)uracil reductase RibD [Proteiniphilum sp.]NCD13661.1 bifunctional diaminohydroxyphosphoribosylaminopyrimidine deaminase/5-amino-6-(5-phosphoribosylamino)uracil reductase RibD [Bacteroidia bacterium]HHT34510.1 bifunctional diaminohydroxyphosphoribosylaminopyrimidine deaminase/5-amino-6-(5-phosphoribosylamino)uracil reductase RibD [Bacteroidales bacterium]MDD2725705.1 bifunctional diaminohydroxyp